MATINLSSPMHSSSSSPRSLSSHSPKNTPTLSFYSHPKPSQLFPSMSLRNKTKHRTIHKHQTSMAAKRLYGDDGIYRSPRPPLFLPTDPNQSMVPFLFRNLPSLSHHLALVDAETGETFTFSNLKTKISILAGSLLLKLNIAKNDIVLILAPNSIHFPVSFLAVVAVGAVATPANPRHTVRKLSRQVKDSNPKLIITTKEFFHKVEQFNLPCIILGPKTPIQETEKTSKLWYYEDLINNSSTTVSNFPAVLQSDVATILYSSGTTGRSKGVVLTHRNFIVAAVMATSDQEFYGEEKNVYLCFLPMFHIYGLLWVTYAQLQRGSKVVSMAAFETERVFSAIEKYRVTTLFVVPPIVVALVKQSEAAKKYNLSPLKEIGSGAAPLGKVVMEEYAKTFPQAVVFQCYGMTETCGVISLENTRIGSLHSGSTGVLAPGVESQILSVDKMKPLPPNELGEIWVRGPNMSQGYFDNPEETELTVDKEGWVHTGDIGYFDGEERLYVMDRIKELIKYKGFQVVPAELEWLLLTHPQLSNAVVIPLSDAEAGEVPIACVVRSPGSLLTEEEVQKFIANQVAPFKRLQGVTFMDSVPKSALGKNLRRQLKQKVQFKL